MPTPEDRWLDHAAGPVVRPYAFTNGRTMSATDRSIGLLDVVVAVAGPPPGAGLQLRPEHRQLLARCQRPVTVADLASDIDLPIGVLQVLVSDLSEHGIVRVAATPRGPVTSTRLLQDVLNGLRAL